MGLWVHGDLMRFVVQEHHATHLHWDFRLELDGVLKSWAIPKEPPINRGVKRLAIQVDDHDVSYIDFEGEIPEGYGAGTVRIWDRGEYELKERKNDKLVFSLKGTKLKGEYCLVRFKTREKKRKNWLFFKI